MRLSIQTDKSPRGVDGRRVARLADAGVSRMRWGEVFGDDVVAAAMIDRLVHHADVIALKGDSYRLKDRDLGRVPAANQPDE